MQRYTLVQASVVLACVIGATMLAVLDKINADVVVGFYLVVMGAGVGALGYVNGARKAVTETSVNTANAIAAERSEK